MNSKSATRLARFYVYGFFTHMLSTLIELQRLKRLDRTGWTLRGLPNGTESVAAHSFGVSVIAMLLADKFIEIGIDVNIEKVLRIALLHDWAEVRVGDMPRTATLYFGSEARKQAETAAFSDIVSEIGDGSNLYTNLHDDYEHRSSLEARLVKTADVLDLLLQVLALERAGARGLDEFWEVAARPEFNLDGAGEQIVEELLQSILNARIELHNNG
jgi:putative hydrolase of HD superfamily